MMCLVKNKNSVSVFSVITKSSTTALRWHRLMFSMLLIQLALSIIKDTFRRCVFLFPSKTPDGEGLEFGLENLVPIAQDHKCCLGLVCVSAQDALVNWLVMWLMTEHTEVGVVMLVE